VLVVQAALVVFDDRYSDAVDIPTSDEEDAAGDAKATTSAGALDKGKGKVREVVKLPVSSLFGSKLSELSSVAEHAYSRRPRMKMQEAKMKWTTRTTMPTTTVSTTTMI